MKMPMIGGEYLNKLFGSTTGKLKKLAKPLFKDGVGDLMDKGNLFIVPGFTLLAFAVLWTTKLSKIALEEATCKGASIYDFTGSKLDEDAQKHCQTSKRYYVLPDEHIPYDLKWREQRTVKNPEWILWFWAPIVFVMYVLMRFIWTVLLDNQGINFTNIVNASQSVMEDNDGVTEVDEEKLCERLPVIADNFRSASSTHAFAAFLTFEICLVIAPLLLLIVVLPLMIGSTYRTYGLDIAIAWWENREWKGVPIKAALASKPTLQVPLVPRITYCDYHFVSMGNSHILTYRCYMDANWHERTALFTWAMLIFLAFINFVNLFFWVLWAIRMRNRRKRKFWVMKKWLNQEGFTLNERKYMADFAEIFKFGNLLLFYYIEAHTDRTVASAFCTALFQRWLEIQINDEIMPIDNRVVIHMPEPTAPPQSPERKIGWELDGADTEAPESLPPSYSSGEPNLPRIYSYPRISLRHPRFHRRISYDSSRRRATYYDRYERRFKEVQTEKVDSATQAAATVDTTTQAEIATTSDASKKPAGK